MKVCRQKRCKNVKNFLSKFIILTFCAGLCTGAICCNAGAEATTLNKEYKIFKCNEEGTCIVRNKVLKSSIADKDANVLLPFEYSSISIATDGSNNFILRKDNKTGIADKNGKIIIPCEYLLIIHLKNTGKYKIKPDWSENVGLADMKTGHIDVPPVYQYIAPMQNGAYLVENNDKQGVLNENFKLIIPAEYYFIMLFPGHKYYRLHKVVTFTNQEGLPQTQDKYGIADINGNIVVPVECSWIDKNLSSYKQKVIKDGKNYIFDAKTGVLQKV